MPGWWVVSMVVAVVAAMLAMSNDLVVVSTLYSFGLLFPVWLLAANLWWLLALYGVWHLATRWLGTTKGTALFVALVAGWAAWTQIDTARQVAQLESSRPQIVPQTLKGAVRSIDYSSTGDGWGSGSFSPYETCDPLCMALMRGGDMEWLRLVRFETVDSAHVVFPAFGNTCADLNAAPLDKGCMAAPRVARLTTIIERLDPAVCRRRMPDFPKGEPCLRFAPDDGRKADLSLSLKAADGEERKTASTAAVRVTTLHALMLTDERGTEPQLLAQTYALGYTTPSLVPFFAVRMNMQGGEGGLQRWHVSHTEPPPDAAQTLAAVGLSLAPLRQDEPFHVSPGLVVAFSPTIRALADSLPSDPKTIWTRMDPPKPPPSPPQKKRSKAEIDASKRARRAAESKMITDAIQEGLRQTGAMPPQAPIRD